ncbi:putative glycine N-acyltransferase-like protein 1B isoform X2 [Ambystoma mexicanum]|uniref:putative glycine N-acyltransferase-like protein 1B isoform X2 n=1 Tax=Ambystoma mexicanum TaxID=8296 RepID=UPI0037E7EB4A
MLVLESSEDRAKLEELLAKSVPESLRVYGSVFYINRGNPFNMEVLVDSWPDFKTVISKSQPMEMVNDLDIYTNAYFIFTKDPKDLAKILQTTNVINWTQCFQIEGLQKCLDDVIMAVAESKRVDVERDQALLFVRDIHLGDSDMKPNMNSEKTSTLQTSSQHKERGGHPELPLSPLREADAELVNANWVNGGNVESLNFARRCIQKLPTLCMLDLEGKPISWYVMDQTAEMRMAYTIPEFRRRGLSTRLLESFMDTLCRQWHDFPFYFITGEDNKQAQGVARKVGLREAPCRYRRWICRTFAKSF